MNAERKLTFLINNPNLDTDLKRIAEKVLAEERISFDEGVILYTKGELNYLGVLANYIREKKHGNYTYFNRNFHIEPTNVCVYDCKFCSYSRMIKELEDVCELYVAVLLYVVRKFENKIVIEVHLNGCV